MNKKTLLGFISALSLFAAGNAVYAQDTTADPNPPPPPPHAPSLAGVVDRLIQKYDANQDGQLDANEIAALRKAVESEPVGFRGPAMRHGRVQAGAPVPHLSKELMENYDKDADGKLNPEERAALRQDVEQGKVSLPGPGLRGPRPSGPPHVSDPAEVLQKFDANGNGTLEERELAEFLKGMVAHGHPTPPHAPVPPETPDDSQ